MSEERSSATIVLPVHKERYYIDRAIKCITNQSYENFDAIILPTEVSEYSIERIKQAADNFPYIKYEIVPEDFNTAQSRNRGIEQTNADYICCYDADDVMHSRRVEDQIRFMDAKGADFCGQHRDRVRIVNGDDEILQEYNSEHIRLDDIENPGDRNIIPHCTTMFANNGLKYREKFEYNAGYDIYLRALTKDMTVMITTQDLCTKLIRGDSKTRKSIRTSNTWGNIARYLYYERIEYGDDSYDSERFWNRTDMIL